MFQFPNVGACRGTPVLANPIHAVANRNAKFISNGRSAERPYTLANFLLARMMW
jgi:hypothetical protein